ncbi:MAG: hypothetical protein HY361_00815 [Candidatus Aenigmarchaeota archaeon]|nr:hypothetical protein [Candidatus Aenigmarchaeota archaeon]
MAAKKNEDMSKVGEWAFLGGVLLAVLVGLIPGVLPGNLVALVLVVLGLLVGLINIGAKETHSFLLASVALLVAGAAGLQTLPVVGGIVSSVLTNLVSFVAPAAVIVALKAVYEHGR